MAFFSEQLESIEEMAAPKMPEGIKRKRHDTYAHAHNIYINGEHHAVVIGHKVHERGVPSHVKTYKVYKNDDDLLSSHTAEVSGHPDHRGPAMGQFYHPDKGYHTKEVIRPHEYGSMEDAVNAIHHTYHNNKEFGKNHDPRHRWQKALVSANGAKDHADKTAKYKTAIHAARAVGHEDIADQLQKHHDAHVAAGPATGVGKDKLHQWTHDAHRYTGTHHINHPADENHKYGHRTYNHPDHPEHHELATKAHDLHLKTGPHSYHY